jgi:hypothetical protein
MSNVKTSGPKVRQIVLYNDAVFGSIAAIITQSSQDSTGGGISLTTFPPGVPPQTQTGVQYDNTGTLVGRWRYELTEYA